MQINGVDCFKAKCRKREKQCEICGNKIEVGAEMFTRYRAKEVISSNFMGSNMIWHDGRKTLYLCSEECVTLTGLQTFGEKQMHYRNGSYSVIAPRRRF